MRKDCTQLLSRALVRGEPGPYLGRALSRHVPRLITLAAVLGALLGGASPSSTFEPVVWTNAVNVSVSGNSLTKTGTAGWTGGAVSTKTLSANGFVEFTVTPPGTHRVLGLGNGDTNQDISDVEFGLLLADGGTLAVYERGIYVGSFGVPAAGERLRIAVVDGKVRYYRNGQQFYESAAVPTFPLLVDTSLNEPGATVSGVMLAGPWKEPASEPIVWTNAVNVSVSGNRITKTGTVGWNGGAVSTKTLSGSGSAEFVVGPRGTHRAFGLGTGDTNQHLDDIEFALVLADGGSLSVYEQGRLVGSFSIPEPGERLRVSVEGGRVRYYRGAQQFYESTQAPTFPLRVDTSLYEPGASVGGVRLVGPWQ